MSGRASLPRLSRREALRLLAAHLPLALAGCSKPAREIVPYVTLPETVEPGIPKRFASVLPLSGLGRGVIVTSLEGRPTKIEGNPDHPASLGATDVFAEASVLSLYDPDRSRTPLADGQIISWPALEGALQPLLDRLRGDQGVGFALLTSRLASPTFESQIETFKSTFPKARWFAYDPLENVAADEGARIAFGRRASTLPDLSQADVLLSLDADVLGPGPDQIRLSRAYAERRLAAGRKLSRLYVAEASMTQTGGKADHRRAMSPATMFEAIVHIANAFGAGLRPAQLSPEEQSFFDTVTADLRTQDARGLILVGRSLPPEAHALAHWINARLTAPVTLIPPPDAIDGHQPEALDALAAALDAGDVTFLAALDVNPAYDAPADLDLSTRLAKAGAVFHAGVYHDETAALARWHAPLSHPLEAWSDLRAADGTAAIVQPLIRPLYATRSHAEVLALLFGQQGAVDYDLVRATWKRSGDDAWWSSTLARGVIPQTAAAPLTFPQANLPASIPEPGTTELTLLLRPDPCLWDGSFANNAWLQELPKPLTKQVWGHALEIGADDAAMQGLETGDVVEINFQNRSIECPVLIIDGQAKGVLTLSLGFGRRRAGAIGTDIGANAYLLRRFEHPWVVPKPDLRKTGRKEDVLVAQRVVRVPDIDRATLDKRFPVHSGAAASPAGRDDAEPSLYPERPIAPAEHAWGMVIDTALCTGCSACMVACQAENNIPVVGPEEIDQGRQMHWLRVDVYRLDGIKDEGLGFQPVPCMHCEKAPCEPVCPVEASVHDAEGLNVQVYNRCIGTRFCEANCPYKVRRFNFRGYADGEEFKNLGAESYRAQKNPEVTVRTRGVMEKCTYCVQRISAARRRSEREDTPIGADEVVTACQAACPTRAITFGDLNRAESEVAGLKRDARHYALLGELDTRPRTTYLADLRSANPALGEIEE